MSAVYDWEAERFIPVEHAPVEYDDSVAVPTYENDPTWVPWCREHPRWGYGSQVPVIPPASACPFCSERQPEQEAPSTQSRFETDPAAILNAQAPARVAEEWRRKESRRRIVERARMERNDEIRYLETIIDSEVTADYLPPGPMAYKSHVTPRRRKAHARKVARAKARLNVLLSTPLDVPSETEWNDGREEMWTVQG